MGSPSFVEYQYIEIYEDKFEEFVNFVEANTKEGDEQYFDKIEIDRETKEVTIDLNELKIIQYWYKNFLIFLEDISQFIKEGNIGLYNPENFELANIVFKNGKVECIEMSEMKRFEFEEVKRWKEE